MTTHRTERRLTTILAADVVGYSKLVGRDEAGTVAAVKSGNVEIIEPRCEQYRGRIVKFMGDGVLMEFSSVVDAVLFAVEMQGAMSAANEPRDADRQVIYRIGINIGEIIVDGDDIQGNGINIAARIESIADPGGIFLSDAAHAQVTGKVELDFEQRGEFEVKNIAEPVSVWAVTINDKAENILTPVPKPDPGPGPNSGPGRRPIPLAALAAAITVVALAGAGFWYFGNTTTDQSVDQPVVLKLPDEPSVAVLPFKTIGDENAETYFSEGITSDLVTGLSKFSGLFVSSSNSTSQLSVDKTNLAEAGESLGVRYILQGSVQRAAQRVRVNASLVEAGTSQNLWSQKYDRDIADIFAVQDEIVGEIISALTVNVHENERKRSLAKPPSSMQAYDFYLRGRDLRSKGNREDNFESQNMYQKAIELDPAFALAYTGLGWAILREINNGWAHDPAKRLKRAHDLAEAALATESHAQGYALLGETYLLMKHFDLARENLDLAIERNPNDATSYGALGGVSLMTSQLDQAEAAYARSMRLDPKSSGSVLTGLGTTLFLMDRYKEALPHLEKSAIREPGNLFTYLMLAATYGELGRDDEAKLAADKVRTMHPFFEVAPYRAAFTNPEHGNSLAESLAAAGLQ